VHGNRKAAQGMRVEVGEGVGEGLVRIVPLVLRGPAAQYRHSPAAGPRGELRQQSALADACLARDVDDRRTALPRCFSARSSRASSEDRLTDSVPSTSRSGRPYASPTKLVFAVGRPLRRLRTSLLPSR
jgi:hypothetical protein